MDSSSRVGKHSAPGLMVLCVIVAAGCRHRSDSSAPPSITAQRVPFQYADLKPENYGTPAATLVFYGTHVPVKVNAKKTGDILDLRFISHDEEIESERYRYSDREFDLVQAAEDTFTPPIPLLKFSFTTGDSWDWKGTLKEGNATRSASAQIRTSFDRVQIKTLWTDCAKSDVLLSIDSGTAAPATRQLSFWFAAGQGPFKRTFGLGSTRTLPEDEKAAK